MFLLEWGKISAGENGNSNAVGLDAEVTTSILGTRGESRR